METQTRKFRIAFAVSLCLLVLISLIYLCADRFTYLSYVDSLPENQEYEHHSLQPYFHYAGQSVIMDQEDTLYLPVDLSRASDADSLFSSLQLKRPGYRFSLLQDAYFENPLEGIRVGHPFTLVILDPLQHYMTCKVVFTSLPVIVLSPEDRRVDTEKERAVYSGTVLLQDPAKIGEFPEFSEAEWHVRGVSSAASVKPPRKLNLKNSKHKKQGLNLLGLGKDDDWILNPMNMDDTKVREMLFMELWNSVSGDTLPMSTGRYVELIEDGNYMGLYLLQRRVDSKYLALSDDDWLFKGYSSWTPKTVQEAYELISGSQDGYQLMEPVWTGEDMHILDLSNFIDVSLFLQLSCATDNTGCKNMFYILHNEPSGPRLELLPWDTDMSFGIVWDDGFAYDFDSCHCKSPDRMELDSLQKQVPDIGKQMAQRWFSLRENVFSQENIFSTLDSLIAELTESGAFLRDQSVFKALYGDEDTHAALKNWIQERLDFLDQYYSES